MSKGIWEADWRDCQSRGDGSHGNILEAVQGEEGCWGRAAVDARHIPATRATEVIKISLFHASLEESRKSLCARSLQTLKRGFLS